MPIKKTILYDHQVIWFDEPPTAKTYAQKKNLDTAEPPI